MPTNGNSAGLLLYLMSPAGDPEAEQVFARMLEDAGTMGTTGEYLTVSNDAFAAANASAPTRRHSISARRWSFSAPAELSPPAA